MQEIHLNHQVIEVIEELVYRQRSKLQKYEEEKLNQNEQTSDKIYFIPSRSRNGIWTVSVKNPRSSKT